MPDIAARVLALKASRSWRKVLPLATAGVLALGVSWTLWLALNAYIEELTLHRATS